MLYISLFQPISIGNQFRRSFMSIRDTEYYFEFAYKELFKIKKIESENVPEHDNLKYKILATNILLFLIFAILTFLSFNSNNPSINNNFVKSITTGGFFVFAIYINLFWFNQLKTDLYIKVWKSYLTENGRIDVENMTSSKLKDEIDKIINYDE